MLFALLITFAVAPPVLTEIHWDPIQPIHHCWPLSDPPLPSGYAGAMECNHLGPMPAVLGRTVTYPVHHGHSGRPVVSYLCPVHLAELILPLCPMHHRQLSVQGNDADRYEDELLGLCNQFQREQYRRLFLDYGHPDVNTPNVEIDGGVVYDRISDFGLHPRKPKKLFPVEPLTRLTLSSPLIGVYCDVVGFKYCSLDDTLGSPPTNQGSDLAIAFLCYDSTGLADVRPRRQNNATVSVNFLSEAFLVETPLTSCWSSWQPRYHHDISTGPY